MLATLYTFLYIYPKCIGSGIQNTGKPNKLLYVTTCVEFNNLIVNHKEKFFLFYLNISSLPYLFQDLNYLLKSIKKNFSIIGVTESRLKVNSQPLINIDLSNYNIESTPTKSEKGGRLLCISSGLNYKV